MTEAEFLEFIRKAAHRATNPIGRIGNLVCTQAESTGEPTLREPEMRTALQQQADEDGFLYGIEVPTLYTYRFSGKGVRGRRALTDFAILSTDEPKAACSVLVELKEGQSHRIGEVGVDDDYPAITKDLHKLRAEPFAHGACMLHICQAENSGTLVALQHKYSVAMRLAVLRASATIQCYPTVSRDHLKDRDRWFLLVMLILHPRGVKNMGKGAYLVRGEWQESEQEWRWSEPEFPSSREQSPFRYP